MRCIALYEKGNSGKSTTIIKLINILVSGGASEYECDKIAGEKVSVIRLGGKKIGITSRGDDKSVLKDDFSLLGECDLYVCASRTKGQTKEYLTEKFGDEIIWQRKWRVTEPESYTKSKYDEINDFQAQFLSDLIKML